MNLSEFLRIFTKKNFLFISLILLFSFIPSGFSIPENVIYGSSSFEKLPIIKAGTSSEFQIKLLYNSGQYTITELKPIIDIYPVSMSQYLTIETETSKQYMHPISMVIVKGNMTVSPDIPAGKVSLMYYFSGKDILGNSYRSSWNGSSPPIDIKNEHTTLELKVSLEKASEAIEPAKFVINYEDPPLKQFRAGLPNEEIKCKEGFELVIKSSSGFHSCIKPQSKQKLMDRGWAISVQTFP